MSSYLGESEFVKKQSPPPPIKKIEVEGLSTIGCVLLMIAAGVLLAAGALIHIAISLSTKVP